MHGTKICEGTKTQMQNIFSTLSSVASIISQRRVVYKYIPIMAETLKEFLELYKIRYKNFVNFFKIIFEEICCEIDKICISYDQMNNILELKNCQLVKQLM